jgi:hypothetical protein
MAAIDLELVRLSPEQRIRELELEMRRLRSQRDREIQARLFAEELLARGLHPPASERYDRQGRLSAVPREY